MDLHYFFDFWNKTIDIITVSRTVFYIHCLYIMEEKEERSHFITRHACRGLLQAAKGFPPLRGTSSPSLLVARCLFSLFVNGPSHWRGALHAAPSHSKWWDFRRWSKERRGAARQRRDGEWRARKGEWGERSRIKVLLRPAFATAFASLLRSRGTMTNPRRHCDCPRQNLRKSAEKRGKRWKEFDAGAYAGRRRANAREGLRADGRKGGRGTLKELVYASGDDHSPLITWIIVQGQRRQHT